MKHRGEIVKKALKEKGVSYAEVARRINVHRDTIYNWIETSNLPFDKVLAVGKAIHHDFTRDMPDLIRFVDDGVVKEEDYKEKYFTLLEEHNSVLKKHNDALDRMEKMNEQLIGLLAEKLDKLKRAK